jgi:hypothetical protein
VDALLAVSGEFKCDTDYSLDLFLRVSEGVDCSATTGVLPAAFRLTEVQATSEFTDDDEIDILEELWSQR